MNITSQITFGMNSEEKEIFFAHMERRHRFEAEKIEAEKLALKSYRLDLIDDILRMSNNFKRENLMKCSTSTLERIFDHI